MSKSLKFFKSYNTRFDDSFLAIITDRNISFMHLFWDNNKYLRKYYRKSKAKQCRELRLVGFCTTPKTILRGEVHLLNSLSLFYLQTIAWYWGLSLFEMLYVDLSKESTIKQMMILKAL